MSDPINSVESLPLWASAAKERAPRAVRGMVRARSTSTQIDAARQASETAARMKARVYQAFLEHGPMNDGELENLPEFDGCAMQSVRKRRTDLVAAGALECAGIKRGHPDRPRSMMLVWRVPDQRPHDGD